MPSPQRISWLIVQVEDGHCQCEEIAEENRLKSRLDNDSTRLFQESIPVAVAHDRGVLLKASRHGVSSTSGSGRGRGDAPHVR